MEQKRGGCPPLLIIRLRAVYLLLVAVGRIAQGQRAEEGLSLTLELEHDDPALLGVFADDLAELFHGLDGLQVGAQDDVAFPEFRFGGQLAGSTPTMRRPVPGLTVGGTGFFLGQRPDGQADGRGILFNGAAGLARKRP